jgi:beta-glucuronidase
MLYPRESESREIKDLSGIWSFKLDKESKGYEKRWYKKELTNTIMMPVPASYNDITQKKEIRDHIGDVWYEKTFFIPYSWQNKRIVMRVDSATHFATMWVNGEKTIEHKGGYLPFEVDISELIKYGVENRVTIAVNNILDWTTLPPGEIKTFDDPKHPEGYRVQEYYHDFLNYAGIHRPVKLYTTPKAYIDNIKVVTNIEDNQGIISYDIDVSDDSNLVEVNLIDEEKNRIISEIGKSGRLVIEEANFWAPGKPYLYSLEVKLKSDSKDIDIYRLPVGIRTVEVTNKDILINGDPFYFKGFGKHEDANIRGKGLDQVINVKDFNLLEWIGANSFRTSHYPYSEEIMNLADEKGILVIDESTAVGLNLWDKSKKVFCAERAGEEILAHHLKVMEELIERDKNHPSVVMWSVANEANTYEEAALPYFQKIVDKTRELDPTRPVTIVQSSLPDECKVAQLFDVICVNRYYSWYEDPGHLELIEGQVEWELRGWHDNFNKPVIMAEYGADAISGFHQDPPVMFTEEYQYELLKHYHNVFDKLDFIIGEHIWNFADFATKQGVKRILGNRKGIFTRERQPKKAAYLLKKRWPDKGE